MKVEKAPSEWRGSCAQAEPITNGGSNSELNNHNFCPDEWVPNYKRPWNG